MLNLSCATLHGVGPALAIKLSKCGIDTLQDLILHLPYRYQDRTRVTAISDIRDHEWCVLLGRVCKTQIQYGKRRSLMVYLEDKTGVIKLRFFHFHPQQTKVLETHPLLLVFGEVRRHGQVPEMIHPEYRLIEEDAPIEVEEALTPIYPSTAGLSQQRLRQFIQQALIENQPHLQSIEWMNEKLLTKFSVLPMIEALHYLHHPQPDTHLETLEKGTHPAVKRLIIEELMVEQLSMLSARQQQKNLNAPAMPNKAPIVQQLISQLPFQLTGAQQRAWLSIEQDLQHSAPMLRLVQGDVGAGKTIVAALAALHAVHHGFQVAVMAPTDILSEQHFESFIQWFNPLNIQVIRLSGKLKIAEKRLALAKIDNGEAQVIIGTHALFQQKVVFKNLGLIIIDEQHRFGVEQRQQLQKKGQQTPHQLLMTATPIPRSLAMTKLAHLDLSIIDERPPGRGKIITAVLQQEKRQQIIERLTLAIKSGRQAYWVCTLIEESEQLQCIAATQTAEALQAQLPEFKIGLIHGKLPATEKDLIMRAFKAHEIHLLVATTVIEVGVDVSNASLMIIENAERLGLSQLHQLRGRVGRGKTDSHCLLLYQSPLSQEGKQRLNVLRETADGFKIAEFDLTLRGRGELLGTQQTGYVPYRIVKLERDKALIPSVSQVAQLLLKNNPALAEQIIQRWHGQRQQYLQS